MSPRKSQSKGQTRSATLKLVSVSVTHALLVWEYLSFRWAASVLGVGQSAVSRRVRELEDELGVSLFERHHAGVRVTNAGVYFLQRAREAVLQLDDAANTASAAGRGAEWTDLRSERIIVRQSERDPALCDRLTKRLSDRDHNPRVQKLNVGRETLMNLVAMGLGIGLTSEATAATPFSKVVFRPIAGDDELLQFSAAWLPHNDNPALRRFLSLARSLAKQKRRRPGAVSGRPSLGSPVTSGISLFLASLGALAKRLGLLTRNVPASGR
jgi:DNA-binding transcriptional LysR family regulator